MHPIFSKLEKEILDFWRQKDIFHKSIQQKPEKKSWTFYDGPPFATGLPHYGHILAGTIKDILPRYWTMKGCRVERRAGWDCHGLPVEYEMEKELGISGKKAIEEWGIEKFNQACRGNVLRYVNEWEKTIERMGRWIDFQNAYRTMDRDYMESIWWVFKQVWRKGLIYRDYRSVPYCPRCSTPLSNFEVNLGYRENVEDPSIFVKFPLKGEDKTYFLAWTTTPWTLPGNVALAVGENFEYAKIKVSDGYFILARERLKEIKEPYEITDHYLGKDLVGWQYEPLYNFIQPDKPAWFVVKADFVSLEEGTGIVHIAPAYGEEDFNLGKELGLPVICLVDAEGMMTRETKWPKKFVKDADPLVIQDLKERGLLYRLEKIYHTYPFCWRCEAPVYDYLWPSWFIRVIAIKDKLLKNNRKINWFPRHIKDGRFGKWLEGARDWNISRNRYWGTPIPIWQCQNCQNLEVIGSLRELDDKRIPQRQLIIIRHGEAEQNILNICNGDISKEYHLTAKGRREVEILAKKLVQEKVDLIFSSDFIRAKETAEILNQVFKTKIIYDSRLRDVNCGVFEGKKVKESQNFRKQSDNFYQVKYPGGESFLDIEGRVKDLLKDLEDRFKGKTVLIVTHEDVIKAIYCLFGLAARNETVDKLKIPVASFHNFKEPIFDIHRPFIDQIKLKCEKCGGEMKRTPEVLDCWFESGSMPYAEKHYPFENKEKFEKNFPADFIAEGLDQTRGWFYTLHVLSTILFNQPAFKNVIVNGLVLAEDGRKMSKRLKNYPDPDYIFDQYGADALRFYLTKSPAVKAEDLCFSEKGVLEITKKILILFWNLYSFWQIYGVKELTIYPSKLPKSKNVLDQWILVRLNFLIKDLTDQLDSLNLFQAGRGIEDFINDLSTWYLRRSRERFKNQAVTKEKKEASQILFYLLLTLSKIMAPLVPFLAEEIYQRLIKDIKGRSNNFKESVHLEDWPIPDKNLFQRQVLEEMILVRQICEIGHALRIKAGLAVKQPLSGLEIRGQKLKIKSELLELIKKELNIEQVKIVKNLSEEDKWIINKNDTLTVAMNTEITLELREEGIVRQLVRQINVLRKDMDLTPQDRVIVCLGIQDKNLIEILKRFENQIQREVLADQLKYQIEGYVELKREFELAGQRILLGIQRI